MRTCRRLEIVLLIFAALLSRCVHSNFSLLDKSGTPDAAASAQADTSALGRQEKTQPAAIGAAPVSPQPEPVQRPAPGPQATPAPPDDTLDFALALGDAPSLPSAAPPAVSPAVEPEPVKPQPVAPSPEPAPVLGAPPPRHHAFDVPGTMVRILMRRNASEAVLYSLGALSAADGTKHAEVPERGRIAVGRAASRGRVTLTTASGRSAQFTLPCTLSCRSSDNVVEIDTGSFRGGVILAAGSGNTFAVMNWVPVEEYLRGVVPLEMGKRPAADVEALKAQAVAARTYTYARLQNTADSAWDLLPTVADQVYGGITAEYAVADQAIEQTAGVIMTYGDRPISAYYHSTCGGRTASIQDVWEKDAAPYLVSMDDRDRSGTAYCAVSRYTAWEKRWTAQRFSTLVGKFGEPYMRDGAFAGRIEKMRVVSRYACGRIKRLLVTGSRGSCEFGSDKVRYALRQDQAGNPILPSARFEVVKAGGAGVVIRGQGNGHGVGMCQMGALGRAEKGQNFEQILRAYYKGAELRSVAGR